MHVQLNADQWFTLSIPLTRSGEVFEVPDISQVRSKITDEKDLVEIPKPDKYVKLGDGSNMTYIETDKDTKVRLMTERAERNAKRLDKREPAKPEKADKPKG
jgi:hypothetical protein